MMIQIFSFSLSLWVDIKISLRSHWLKLFSQSLSQIKPIKSTNTMKSSLDTPMASNLTAPDYVLITCKYLSFCFTHHTFQATLLLLILSPFPGKPLNTFLHLLHSNFFKSHLRLHPSNKSTLSVEDGIMVLLCVGVLLCLFPPLLSILQSKVQVMSESLQITEKNLEFFQSRASI